MRKRRKIDYHEFDTPQPDRFPDTGHAASASDCTGLMYRTPVSGEEWESLQELSPMEIPKTEGDMDHTAADEYHKGAQRRTAKGMA